MITLRTRLIVILLLVSSLLTMPQVMAQEQPVLELVIALDTSGSMSAPSTGNFNDRLSVDYGNNLIFSNEGVSTNATDPDAVRFRTTEALLNWLATYATASSTDIQINVAVVGFDTTATVLRPMTPLSAGDADAGIQLEEPAALSADADGDGRHSDFINLYETVEDLYAPVDDVNHAAFVLVTDSPPCNPTSDETRVNGQSVRNQFCDNDRGVLAPHLAVAPSLPAHVEEYVFFLNPTGRNAEPLTADQYWSVYDNVRDQWTQRVGSFFFDLPVVDDLPQQMLDALLRATGRALNRIDPEETPGLGLGAAQYRRLGFLYTRSATFDVPPFQQRLNTLALSDTDNISLAYLAPDGDDVDATTRLTAVNRRVQLQTIAQPDPGDWTIDPDAAGSLMWWGLLEPATVAVELVPSPVERYQPQQLRYQLLDEDNNPLPVTEDVSPRFDLTVNAPGGTTINLGTLGVNSDGDGFISQSFLPVENGSYEAQLEVEPGQGSLWTSDVTYDFLQPDDIDFVAAPLTFNMAYLVDGTPEGSPVDMPRSLPLTLRLTASANNEPTSLPDGLVAEIRLVSPSAGTPDACLPVDTTAMQIAPDNSAATYQLDFDEPGQCTIAVDLSLDSPLPPLNGDETLALPSIGLERQINVSNTRLLSVVVLDENGNDITANAPDTPDFTLDWPLEDSESLLVEIRDEAGQLIWPDFSPTADRVDADVCPSDERIVPFALRITDSSGDDVALPNGICLQATDETGRYRTAISDLPPGSYQVRVLVNRNEPRLDVNEFEYNPSQFSAEQTEIVGRLQVSIPLFLWAIAAAVLAIVAGIVSSMVRLFNRRLKRLRGSVAFYGVPVNVHERVLSGDDEIDASPVLLWRDEWPSQVDYRFRSREFLRQDYLKEMAIQSLEGTTAGDRTRSRQHGALITLIQQIDGRTVNRLNRDEFASGQARHVATVNDMWIYLMQDAPERVRLDDLVTHPDTETDGQDA